MGVSARAIEKASQRGDIEVRRFTLRRRQTRVKSGGRSIPKVENSQSKGSQMGGNWALFEARKTNLVGA